jgi:nucleotide-binding universal stress UspA family protein
MHVLVATEGQLDPEIVAKFVSPLTGDGGKATVLTVIEVPRAMLQDLRAHFNDQQPPELLRTDIETVTTIARNEPPRSWPGDDAIINQYLRSKQEQICGPLVDALHTAGIDTDAMVVEGKAANGILDTAKELDCDVIIIGSHGAGLFEGLLGSTGTKVTRLAKRPVLLLRTNTG